MMKLPAHDIYALIADYGKVGACLVDCAIDSDANTSLAEAAESFDDNTVGVMRINFAAGAIVDVSKDAARAWMKKHKASFDWGDYPVPPIVETHFGDDIAEELEHAARVAHSHRDYLRAERAYRQQEVI